MWGLKRYINLLYWKAGKVELTINNFDIVEVDGYKFRLTDQVDSIQRVVGNPWFEGVRDNDTVLDIGANIGAITVPLAKKALTVYAVEPIYSNELRDNIELNNLKNVIILRYGLGEKADKVKVRFGDHDGFCEMKPFSEIKRIIGKQIDFFKCDCEGAEWLIQPEELAGIRELRLEFHIRRGREKKDHKILEKWYSWLDTNGYKKNTLYGDDPGPIIPISHVLGIMASKKE